MKETFMKIERDFMINPKFVVLVLLAVAFGFASANVQAAPGDGLVITSGDWSALGINAGDEFRATAGTATSRAASSIHVECEITVVDAVFTFINQDPGVHRRRQAGHGGRLGRPHESPVPVDTACGLLRG